MAIMRSFERRLYNLIRFHPGLKRLFVSLYQGIFSIIPVPKLKSNHEIIIREGHFYGFHDKCPWSPDNTKLLAHKYPNPLKMPVANDKSQVGYFTAPDYDLFHQIGTTKTWNWQMGSMLQWLGNTNKIVFNDYINNQHKAKIVDLNGNIIKQLDRPVATISKDWNWAISHSFIRLQKYAPASNGNKNWKFYCEICDYGCKRRFLMSQHEKTQKHQMLKNAQKCSTQNDEEEKETALHTCKCGKSYKHVQSYKRKRTVA